MPYYFSSTRFYDSGYLPRPTLIFLLLVDRVVVQGIWIGLPLIVEQAAFYVRQRYLIRWLQVPRRLWNG